MGQIPRSIERISSYVKIPASMAYIKLQKFRHLASVSNRQTDTRDAA